MQERPRDRLRGRPVRERARERRSRWRERDRASREPGIEAERGEDEKTSETSCLSPIARSTPLSTAELKRFDARSRLT